MQSLNNLNKQSVVQIVISELSNVCLKYMNNEVYFHNVLLTCLEVIMINRKSKMENGLRKAVNEFPLTT